MRKIKFDNKLNVIIAYVEIKVGDRIVRPKMALDTGTTYVMIPLEIAEALELQPESSRAKTEMITASGVEKIPIVTLDLLRVGEKEVGNVKAIVHDLPPKSYIDGLLGLSFLRNFNLSLDFREEIIELN